MSEIVYEFEDVRTFFVRRGWFRPGELISDEEYTRLKSRTLMFPVGKAAYIRAFIRGWTEARR